MNQLATESRVCGRTFHGVFWAAAGLVLLATSLPLSAAEAVVEIGRAAESRAPRWDARGLGPLSAQGIACLDTSDDGQWIAVGTIAPAGDPNLFVLDGSGKIVGQHRAGHRWLNEVSVSGDGRFVAALCTTPEGTAGDAPRFYAFREGKELTQLSDRFRLRDFHPAGCLFHYGDHSNHLPRVSRWAGQRWVVAGDDAVHWLSPNDSSMAEQAHLGAGVTTAMAASPSGVVVVGRLNVPNKRSGNRAPDGKLPNLLVLKPDAAKPIVWSRPVCDDADPSPEPEKGVYGLPAPPYEDVRFRAPLAVAVDAAGKRIAVADYEGWQRVFHPRDGSQDIPFGLRFMPSRPTIHVYDTEGNTICRVGPEAFAQPFWCDLALSADGRKLFISPHNWTSRGLGGRPFLPADADARMLYVLDVGSGGVRAVRLPDAISSADTGGRDRTAVGCWDGKVYLLDESRVGRAARPTESLAGSNAGGSRSSTHPTSSVDVGAASLVCVSKDGRRITVATTAGVVRQLDADGKPLWETDLNKAATAGDKPWTKDQKPGLLAPGIWRTNGGMAHSDMGSQILVEAPQGLILIDPNAGASFEQNWAKIQGAGLDPMRVKYVLLTHEHGDHAPGAYLWRVATGAQVVASAEMAYILRHHIPGGTGYGFHPPQPVDIAVTEEKDLDLAGLKVKAIRLPGHTSGSMGYVFQKDGKSYVATGDLIMPGGVLGYSGSLDFSAEDALASLKKLASLRPDVVLGGHGGGDPDEFIAKGIEAGEATGWSRMKPPKPNPFCRFTQTNYLVAAWLEPIQSAAFGDVDGDGRPDVAVLVPKGKGSVVKVYLNRGGKFASVPDAELDLPELDRGWKLRLVHVTGGKAADFFVSNEGRAALLLAQQGEKGQLKYKGEKGDSPHLCAAPEGPFRQMGTVPFFAKYRTVPLSITRGSHVAAGDFNGDGRTDLFVGARFVTGYYLACQQADGSFQVRQTKSPTESYLDIAMADVNGDRCEDLITSNGDVFLRQVDGSLAETPAFHLAPPAGEQKGWSFMGAADFDKDGWADVALLANSKEGTAVWLYRNTRNPAKAAEKGTGPICRDGPPGAAHKLDQSPFPSAKFLVPEVDVSRDGPTVADWNGDGTADLILCNRDKQPGVCVLTGSPADGLSPDRAIKVKLDYVPHFDTRFGVADFNGDGRADLAGFGRSPTGAMGVYIWLQPAGVK